MKFELNDKSYELKFTINSLADLEDVTGRSFSEALKGKEFSAARAIFYCGLVESMPKLTLKGAGKVLEEYIGSGHTLDEAFDLMNKAMDEAGFLKAQGMK